MNLYEVEFEARVPMHLTKYVHAESEAQAEEIAQAYAEQCPIEEWTAICDGAGNLAQVSGCKQILSPALLESTERLYAGEILEPTEEEG